MTSRRVLICLMLAAASPLAACAQETFSSSRDHVAQLVDSGQLDEAEAAARAGGDGMRVVLADILVMRGRIDSADSLYRAIIDADGRDARWATAGRAEIAARRRDTSAATQLATTLTAAYERSPTSWSARDQVAVGRAYVVQGIIRPTAVRAALTVFEGVRTLDADGIEARLRGADLLLDRFNGPDAKEIYTEVLRLRPGNARATLGLSRVASFAGESGALAGARTALGANPSLAGAWLQLARLHLEAEAYDSARTAADRALAVDSSAGAAWGTLGAVAWLRGDTVAYAAAERGAQRHRSNIADFHVEIAEAAVRHRRYADASLFAERGVHADSLSARALGVLGVNSLRLGDFAKGRTSLDRAFALDPYNVWTHNNLLLLDEVAKFVTVDTGRFQFVAPPDEIDLVVTYLAPLLEEAYDSLASRYAYRPPTPIRMEVYRNPADFSVRTVGLVGLGALGVSFGPVLAMDSPRAREAGSFNFGSTAWHELAHTFTLGVSDNRVPRWISEGLSVLEERRARAGWGADITMPLLAAFKGGRLLPVSRITEGLVRPSHPLEVGFSYYQASLVMEMIEAERGIGAIRAMLRGYHDGLGTPAVMQRTLRMTPDSLDKHFGAWFAKRFAPMLAAVAPWDGTAPPSGPYPDAVARAKVLQSGGQLAEARTELERAVALVPGYGGADGAAWPLAQVRLQLGDTTGAMAALADITAHTETALLPNRMEAALREARGDVAGARRALQRATWIDAADATSHRRLAELAEQQRDFVQAVRERRAILALAPADRAAARFQYARALMLAGQRDAARREVLALLDDAPSYEDAQLLLLSLSRGN